MTGLAGHAGQEYFHPDQSDLICLLNDHTKVNTFLIFMIFVTGMTCLTGHVGQKYFGLDHTKVNTLFFFPWFSGHTTFAPGHKKFT